MSVVIALVAVLIASLPLVFLMGAAFDRARTDGRARQVRETREALKVSRATTVGYRAFVEQLREQAWDYRDINSELSTVLIQAIRQFNDNQTEIN